MDLGFIRCWNTHQEKRGDQMAVASPSPTVDIDIYTFLHVSLFFPVCATEVPPSLKLRCLSSIVFHTPKSRG